MTALQESTFFSTVSTLAETHYQIRNEDCRTMGFAPIAKVSPDKRLCKDDGREAAERIVAALNACKGVPTDVLSGVSVAGLLFRSQIAGGAGGQHCLLRISVVSQMTGLAKATIYRYLHDGKFPEPVALGGRRVAWREPDVIEWINSRKARISQAPQIAKEG